MRAVVGTPHRFEPGKAPRCHCCGGVGALAGLAGREGCHWCDDSGHALHRCPDCGEAHPGCPCWDDSRGPQRHVPRCACGAAGLLFRRGTVVCARCDVDALIAEAQQTCREDHEAVCRAGELRVLSYRLIAWQVRAEERDTRQGHGDPRAAAANRRLLEQRLRADYRESNRSEHRARVEGLARRYGVPL